MSHEAEKKLIKVYIAVEAVLLIVIKYFEITDAGRPTSISMYCAIVLNTVIAALFYYTYGRERGSDELIAYGLFVTLFADFFLTYLDGEQYYLPGFILFCTVQIIYTAYIDIGMKRAAIRLTMFVLGLVALWRFGLLNITYAAGLLDIVLVTGNAVSSWTMDRPKVPLLFKLGITLFMLCDISILIRSVSQGMIHDAAEFMVFVFYLPSQVMITMSYILTKRNSLIMED